MDLPVEIWMRVFEEIRPDDYVRRACFRKYRHELASLESSQGADTDGTQQHDKLATLRTLPPFEKQVWHRTRAFYAINRNSQAAALRLRLSRRLLMRCKRPARLPHFPEPSTQIKSRWPWRDMAAISLDRFLNRHYLAEIGGCFVFQLPHSPQRGGIGSGYHNFDMRMRRVIGRKGAMLATPLGETQLSVAERVILVATPPHEMECCADWYSLHLLSIVQTAIEKYWQDHGLKNRRVSVYL